MSDFVSFVDRTVVPPGGLALFRLEQNHFLFKTADGLLVHIDPFVSRLVKPENHIHPRPLLEPDEIRADWVFLTHDHRDHTDPDTLGPLARANPECRFVGTRESCDRLRGLGIEAAQLTEASEGARIECGSFGAQAVYARNTGEHDRTTHLGYIFEFGRLRIYNTGDTHRDFETYAERMRAVRDSKPDAMMVPINEGFHNPGPEGARRLVEWVDPARIVPCHYDCFKHNSIEPARFVRALPERLRERVHLLDRGERLVL
ncbi:MBL fold metallo-hydrolase [Candidatus Sumerlaeota bacterium]|nr:MBL fold metallo-hydrolase [Candidatus Sumerlaeota bacterium]